jgi:hypothetical protein
VVVPFGPAMVMVAPETGPLLVLTSPPIAPVLASAKSTPPTSSVDRVTVREDGPDTVGRILVVVATRRLAGR